MTDSASENLLLVFTPALFLFSYTLFAAGTMEELNQMLQRCDKNALVAVVKSLYLHNENDEELLSEKVKVIVCEALFEMQVAKQRQQDKDRNAFAVVLGAREAAGKTDFQVVEAGGRERASTGLLVLKGKMGHP